MFSVSQLHNFSRQYYYLFKFRGLIRRYIVLYFLQKKSLLLPTYYEIRGVVGSQDGTNIHSSAPISLYYLPTNLDTSVADFIYLRSLVESPLKGPLPPDNETEKIYHRYIQISRQVIQTYRQGLMDIGAVLAED